MKWVFFILVMLNLILFAGMMTKNFVLSPSSQQIASSQNPVDNMTEKYYLQQKIEQQQALQQKSSDSIRFQEQRDVSTDIASNARNNPQKSGTKPTSKQNKTDNKKNTQSQTNKKVADKPKETTTKYCGASITLEEDVYLRIRGMLNQWPHAADRDVTKNNKVGQTKKEQGEYWVVVDDKKESDTVFRLLSMGVKPIEENGYLVLGRFSSKEEAKKLLNKLTKADFMSKIIERKSEKTITEPLSKTVYRVTFLKLNNQDETKLEQILKPYGKLVRSSCK